MEVGQAVLALYLLTDELELPEGTLGILILLQVSQRDLVHTALQTIRRNPCQTNTAVNTDRTPNTCGPSDRQTRSLPDNHSGYH